MSLFLDIEKCMTMHRHRLRTELKKNNYHIGEETSFLQSPAGERWQQRHQQSIEVAQTRLNQRPQITDQSLDLPIIQHRDEIINAIQTHAVTLIIGETGSGKTTQVPQLCLAAGCGIYGRIAHTQPRRVAARALSQRLAEELKDSDHKWVGCKYRFFDKTRTENYIQLMTDGWLLTEIVQDRYLTQYDTIILDEVHERSVNLDLLIGWLRYLLPRRPDLKIILMSATLQADIFKTAFPKCAVVEVEGRSFPVSMIYRDPTELNSIETQSQKSNKPDRLDVSPLHLAVIETIRDICSERLEAKSQCRDILVFLPTERDIHQLIILLKREQFSGIDFLPLYSRLETHLQDRIFRPKTSLRRVILSTNIAETSLTVPNIGYVIDSGLARIARFSHRRQIQQLPIDKIAQANAQQRAGRCGRVAAGVCVRLYSESDFLSRPAFTPPEIVRSSLTAVLLNLHQLHFPEPENFLWLTPPEPRAWTVARQQLEELGALQNQQLTSIGKSMARFPLDPRLARMILEAVQKRCLSEIIILASLLSVADFRMNRSDEKAIFIRVRNPKSDFLTALQCWQEIESARQELSRRAFSEWCVTEGVRENSWIEWRQIHHQLLAMCQQLKLPINPEPADESTIHQALLVAFPTHIACRDDQKIPGQYLGVRQRNLAIHPSSALFKKKSDWIVAAEIFETHKLYAHQIAEIDIKWVWPVVEHLVRYEYSEPSWDKQQGRVIAKRKSLLFGLIIRQNEKISYESIDLDASRRLFAQTLVQFELNEDFPFLKINKQRQDQVHAMERRLRRLGILIDEEQREDFYLQRLPSLICNQAALKAWLAENRNERNELLEFPTSFLIPISFQSAADLFPEYLIIQGFKYALEYRFNPGAEDDGVYIKIPLERLTHISDPKLDWLVPGLIAEKCEFLIRSLPKQQRKMFVPIPDFVQQFLNAGYDHDQYFVKDALIDFIQRFKGPIAHSLTWSESLEPRFCVHCQVINNQGIILTTGTNVRELREAILKNHAAVFQKELKIDTTQSWKDSALDWKALRPTLTPAESLQPAPLFPYLSDEKDAVVFSAAADLSLARWRTRIGIRRLLILKVMPELKSWLKDC
ncbi:MAG: ATP-dependent RNA helicase HrpA, partial [Pseudomonadota bacterium]